MVNPDRPATTSRVFANRCAAGRELATAVAEGRLERPMILGLPRGGVPVAYEVAHALGAPLDVLVVRKLGAPDQPELAIGAVGDGVTVIDQETVRLLGVTPEYLERAAQRERQRVREYAAAFRAERPPLDLTGCTAVIVDDGIATGATASAAVDVARRLGATKVIVAAPVAAPEALDRLRTRADGVVCLEAPPWFHAVGYWYEDFAQTEDEEVRQLLRLAALEHQAHYHPAP